MHVPSYGENIWLKHVEIKISFNVGFKGLIKCLINQFYISRTHNYSVQSPQTSSLVCSSSRS